MSSLNRLPRQVFGRSVRDPDQAFRIVEWQRPKPQGVDDAKDRRARADPDRDDQDRKGRQCSIAPQRSRGISQIAQQCFHDAIHAAFP
jgi:hypothetical protein